MGSLTSLKTAWHTYWEQRHPRQHYTVLNHRTIYILPTRAGWLFGLTLATLLVASINYQLNLGYLLTFLLSGCGIVSMYITHRTLRGLGLHLQPPTPAHAYDTVALTIVLANTSKQARYGLGLRLKTPPHANPAAQAGPTMLWTDASAQDTCTVCLSTSFRLRGWHQLPTLAICTRFPFGLFQAWSIWRPAHRALIYPRPEAAPPALPPPIATPSLATLRPSQPSDDMHDVRDYQRGDSRRQIAWKKSSRTLHITGRLVSRDTVQSQEQERWLDWTNAAPLAPEERLTRLTAWILLADQQGYPYGLRLPHLQITPDSGANHRQRCLEALALMPTHSAEH